MGFTLFPWQEDVLRNSLRGGMNGKPWGDSEVCLVVPRQQGKSELLVARMMFGLFMLPNERTIISTAHLVPTAKESFRKMIGRIDANPELKARVRHLYTANGQEGIELKDGSRIRFLARSKGSARGWTADLIIADEAYDLSDDEMAALTPTMTMSPNPQMWYASSTGMPDSFVLNGLRERGIAKTPGLAYFEWSAPDDAENDDIEAICQANPSLGLSHMTIADVWRDLGSLEDERYRRERLGILAPIGGESFIPLEKWRAGAFKGDEPPRLSTLKGTSLGVDVGPDRASAVIAAAGFDDNGKLTTGIVKHDDGTDWVAPFLRDFMDEGGRVGVWLDGTSAASAMEPDFKAARVPKQLIARADYYRACGRFFDLVDRQELVHMDEKALNDAVAAARQGSKGDLWSWSRKDTAANISPLVAVTLAVHGAQKRAGVSSSSRGRRSSGRGSFFG